MGAGIVHSLILLAMLVGSACPLAAAEISAVRPSKPDIGTAQVLGGKPVGTDDYPVTWVFQAGSWGCTATAIGPETILTAAHCIVDTPLGNVSDGARKISVQCTPYPGWNAQYPQKISTYDIALCLAASESGAPSAPALPLDNDTTYERISLVPNEIAPKTRVTLLGYGCTSSPHKGDHLYAGSSTTATQDVGAYVVTGTGSAEFCSGDSGGAVYHETGSLRRGIAGIASRGDGIKSWVTQISVNEIQAFLRSWAAAHVICGINAPKTICHD